MPVSMLDDGQKPFRLLGENIVLWKQSDGTLACLKDRCCHRTAKLSLGFIENDNVVCGYHGWTFDGKGKCVRIPQGGNMENSTLSVPSYHVAEKYGYVWVALDEPLTGIPDLPEASDASFRKIDQFYEPWKIGALRLMENSFDAAHVAYVHRNTFGSTDRPEISKKSVIEMQPFGFSYTTEAQVEVRGTVAHKAVQTNGTQTTRYNESVWYMPFMRRTAIRYPHGLVHVLITASTPVDDENTMVVQWVYRNDTEEQVSTEDVIAFDRAVTLEDKLILESCEPDVPLAVVDGEEMHMASDRPGLTMRRMLTELLDKFGEKEQRFTNIAAD